MFNDFKNSFYQQSFLEKLDFIGKTPNINIRETTSYRTTLGGLFSISIFILTLMATTYFSQEIWKKQKPNVNISKISTPSPKDLMYDENWSFIFGVQYNNVIYIDDGIYTIKGRLFKFIDGKGLIMDEYKIEHCSNNSFHDSNRELFMQYNINNTWCISKENIPELKLSNVWGKPGFSFMDISLWPCKNSTESMICKPKEEIEKKLNVGVFSIYSIYNIIISTDYKSPYKKLIYNDFIPFSYKTFTHSILYLYNSEILSDVGFLLEEIKEDNGFGIDRLKINFYAQPEDDKRFMRFQFQLTNWKENFKRNYIKLQDIAANIGGIINVFYICALIINYCFREFLYRQYLADRFLGFDEKIEETFKFKSNVKLPEIKESNNVVRQISKISSFGNMKISEYEDLKSFKSNEATRNKDIIKSLFLTNKIINANISKDENKSENLNLNLSQSSSHICESNILTLKKNLEIKEVNDFTKTKINENMNEKMNSEIKILSKLNSNESQMSEFANINHNNSNKMNIKELNELYEFTELPIEVKISKNKNLTEGVFCSLIKYYYLDVNDNIIRRVNKCFDEINKNISVEGIIEMNNKLNVIKNVLFTDYENLLIDSFSSKLYQKFSNLEYVYEIINRSDVDMFKTKLYMSLKFKKDEKIIFKDKDTHNSLYEIIKNIK